MKGRRNRPSRARRRAGSNVRSGDRSSARSGSSRVQQHIERMRAMGAPGFRRTKGQTGMTRGQFLRGAAVAGAGVAAAGLELSGVASAHLPHTGDNPDPTKITKSGGVTPADGDGTEPVIWVYPTGDPSRDPRNVQWAVSTYYPEHTAGKPPVPYDDPNTPEDESVPIFVLGVQTGGTVLLKEGTFHFGGSTVYISKKVTIKGEGTLKTKVLGGVMSFTVVGGDPTIQNIWFNGNYFGPILLIACSGVNIIENKITNTIPIDIGFGGPMIFAIGGTDLLSGVPGAVSGTINVVGNYLDLLGSTGGPYFYEAIGIGLFGFLGKVTLNVMENIIWNAGDFAIYLLSFPIPDSTGTVTGNEIHQRTYSFTRPPGTAVGSGIAIGTEAEFFNTPPGYSDVSGNDLYGITGDGIWFGKDSHDSYIKDNTIAVAPGGTGIHVRGDSNHVFGNTVSGDVSGNGFAGIELAYYYHTEFVTGNVVYGDNNVAGTLTQPYRAYDSLWVLNPADQLFYQPENKQDYPHLQDNTFETPSVGAKDIYIVNMNHTQFLTAGNTATGYTQHYVEELNPHAPEARGPKMK